MLAGGVASDSSAGAVSGHDAGKNAVDNNYLTVKQIDDWVAEVKSCRLRAAIAAYYEEISATQHRAAGATDERLR